MTTPTKLIKKTRNVEANFTIPETVASWFHNNPTVKLIQMLQLQIKFGEVQKQFQSIYLQHFFQPYLRWCPLITAFILIKN